MKRYTQSAFDADKRAIKKQGTKCTGGAMVGIQCEHPATWRNQNGVEVCEHHKLQLDAFTWENRNNRKWEAI